MQSARQEISAQQFTYLVAAVLMGFFIMTTSHSKSLEKDAWLGALVALILGLLLTVLYVLWHRIFGGASFGQIFIQQYGSVVGRLFLFAYGIFFLFCSIKLLWFLANFWSSLGMWYTPKIFYIASLVLLIYCICNSGVEVLARLAALSVIFMLLGACLNLLLLVKDFDLLNFLPFGHLQMPTFNWITACTFLNSFGNLVICLPFFCYLPPDGEIKKSFLRGTLLGGILMVLLVARTTAVLGPTSYLFNSPFLQTLRMIDFNEIVSRFEIVGILYVFFASIARCSISFYASALSMQYSLRVQNTKAIFLPLALLAVGLAVGLFGFVTEFSMYAISGGPFFALIFGILIPLLTILIALVRRKLVKI